MGRGALLIAGVAVACAGLAGCGDDDSSGPLTRDEYIEAADELCLGFVEDTDELGQPQTPEELRAFLQTAIELADEVAADFAALQPPAEAEAVHQALRTALDDSTVKVRDALRAVDMGDFDSAQLALDEATRLGQVSDEPAKAFGMQVCGSEAELRDG